MYSNAIESDDWLINDNIKLNIIANNSSNCELLLCQNTATNTANDNIPVELNLRQHNDIEKIYVEDLINYDHYTMNSVQLINTEASIIHFTHTLYDNIITVSKPETEFVKDIINDIISYLKWISDASAVLADRIKQDLTPINSDHTTISRSSYNFCKKTQQCKNFYNLDTKPTCKDHHYVHCLVKHDVDSLIQFLVNCNTDDIFLKKNIESITTTLKTILFVIKHMAKEINFIDHFTQNKADQFHINNLNINKKQSLHNVMNIKNIKKTNTPNLNKNVNNFTSSNIYSLLDE